MLWACTIVAKHIAHINILQINLGGDLAVLQDLFFALILIIFVIYRNAPGLKNFREKYNLGVLTSKLKKDKSVKKEDN